MKSATAAARETLMESHSIRAVPKLLAEWEHNRFSKIKQVNAGDEDKIYVSVTPANDPSDVEWNSIYDINSISMPNRPNTGIAKARLSEPIKLQDGYRDKPAQARFYLASAEDTYKYWSSSQRTKLSPVATSDYEFVTPITLTLIYDEPVISNKIVVGFDLSYARPKSYDIQITEDGTTWQTVSSDVIPNSTTGLVVLWRASDNSETWSNVPNYNGAGWLQGIRLVVRSMNEGYANLDVIQMGLRLEHDLSEFLINYSKDFEISERSFIAPLGRCSSNTATIELTNIDLRFNNENEDSIYYGLIDKKVKFTLDLSVDATPRNGSVDERFREFTMWADTWGGQDDDSVEVGLKDSSVFLQDTEMPNIFWENMTVGAIIWQLMDEVGMTNYNYTREVVDTGQVIPYFWSEEGSVWDQISKLSEGTQTAVWFDEYDVMQIKTRKSVFGPAKTVSWNFDAVPNGQKLADIVDLSGDDDMAVNQVEIKWKPAEFQETKGFPIMETVWEPEEEDIVLRAAALTRDLLVNQMEMFIEQKDVQYWPYESLVNIRGEIIRYRGKDYAYHDVDGKKKFKYIYSKEEKDELDAASHPNMFWANSFTGKLKIAERGVGGSGKTNHKIKSSTYTGKATGYNDNFYIPIDLTRAGMFYNPDGTVTLSSVFGAMDYFAVDHEAEISSSPNATYGTRFKFPKNNIRPDHACAGIRIDGDWGDTGYWIEVSPTYIVERENRVHRHEVSLVHMGTNKAGIRWPMAPNWFNKGYAVTILPDQWYDLDVRHAVRPNGDAQITAYINGVALGSWTIAANLRPVSQRKNSLFVRGNCKCDFEYFYGMNHAASEVPGPDESSYLDLKTGSFTSGFIEREWRFYSYLAHNRGPARFGKWVATSLNSPGNYFFDEFGPIVHEMREFTVDFEEDSVPVGHSYLYFTGQDQIACLDYTADAFSAKFTLVNTMRRDAIVKGEDAVTLGEDNKIQQKIFVYGRTLSNPEDANTIIKKDEDSIRRKGVISLEFDNKFIQSEVAANELGQWVLDQWATGVDELTLNVFGNYLIQLGDLVTINFPAKNMNPSEHKYYVVSLKNSFDKGLTTSLILRRARS